jgi:hypothetical protein
MPIALVHDFPVSAQSVLPGMLRNPSGGAAEGDLIFRFCSQFELPDGEL